MTKKQTIGTTIILLVLFLFIGYMGGIQATEEKQAINQNQVK